VSDTPIKRCVIYTRKSSEEGLDQDYNSLHAQREACEAFVKSQTGEGWRLIKTAYDDGGFSGGSMERPALQRLLADIRQNQIDVVAVYKVDRLTRALADFARMVELFDAHKVSFVAVTQQFNTTTSMGRLTLNVLLSFAQFEREVIGERIRDKVAASKRKGIWMGGPNPIGYYVCERRLMVNQEEAKTVRTIFARYLELGAVRLLKKDLERRGIFSARRTSKKGKLRGGKPFSRGALYSLLSNPIYIGEIRHRRERHPGLHEAIISRELWEQVQRQICSRAVRAGEGRKTSAPASPLAGKLSDESGEPLYVQGSAKGPRRYRYYVSKRLVDGGTGGSDTGWRISAPQLERMITAAAAAILDDRAAIALASEASSKDEQLTAILKSAKSWAEGLRSTTESPSALAELTERVELGREGVKLTLRLPYSTLGTANQASDRLTLTRFVPMVMKRRGVEQRIVLKGASAPSEVYQPLLKSVGRSRKWVHELMAGRVQSVGELARREKLDRRSVRRLLGLGFLSPRIVEAITEGRQPPEMTIIALSRRIDLPLLWSAQDKMLRVS